MSIIKNENGYIQLRIINQLVKNKLVRGSDPIEYKEVVYKEVFTKKWFRKEYISSLEEYITSKNKIAKSRCTIYDSSSGRTLVVNHSLVQLENEIIKNKINSKIGYTCH